MTENEAIEIIQQQRENLHKVGNECQVPCENCKVNHCCFDYVAMGMAIQALEEIQQYRAIGTVKEIKIREAQFARLSEGYLNDLTLLREYQAIGTIEELQELKEKSAAKKPIDKIMYLECPACGDVGILDCGYCSCCGQKLDWGE